jgi:diaminopimelate epimerase
VGPARGGTGYGAVRSSAFVTTLLKFEKWQALGNDYIIVEQDDLPFELSPERIRRLCAPHIGCHADGVLLLARSEDERFVAHLRIFNPDGSEAEISGNGAREATLYIHRHGWTDRDTFSIETPAGEIRPRILDARTCATDMGRAVLQSADFPGGGPDGRGVLRADGREFAFQHVHIGNPQCVIEVGDELERLDLEQVGPQIEQNELFPRRTNVAFIRIEDDSVRARIFERGVGETLSSGTGACAAAVTAVLRGARSPVAVHLDGWAEPVFEGRFSAELVSALEDAP